METKELIGLAANNTLRDAVGIIAYGEETSGEKVDDIEKLLNDFYYYFESDELLMLNKEIRWYLLECLDYKNIPTSYDLIDYLKEYYSAD